MLQTSDTSININQTVQLNPTVLPDNATISNVKYISSNPSVASVSSKGIVTGLALGTTTITVTTKDSAFVATILVHVQQPLALSDIALSASLAQKSVVLNWRIIGDGLVKDCEIQRMGTDGSFKLIGKVNGINSSAPYYSFTHPPTTTGKQYYRIKVNYLDGTSVYSISTMIDIPIKSMKLMVSPNPIKGHKLAVHFEDVPKGWYYLKAVNVAGLLLYQQRFFHSGDKQSYSFRLPINIIKSQMLYLSVFGENEVMPLLKQKLLVEDY